MEEKNRLRRHILQQRKRLTDKQHYEYSMRIWQQIQQTDVYKNAERIFVYMHLPGEVQTFAHIQAAIREKDWYVPKVYQGNMYLMRVNDLTTLKPGEFGVLEPSGKVFYDGDVDLVVTPGLAFDRQGHRLGYGKGYYDRFFAEQRHGVAMGVCLHQFIQEYVPYTHEDYPMDMLMTDRDFIRFN